MSISIEQRNWEKTMQTRYRRRDEHGEIDFEMTAGDSHSMSRWEDPRAQKARQLAGGALNRASSSLGIPPLVVLGGGGLAVCLMFTEIAAAVGRSGMYAACAVLAAGLVSWAVQSRRG